MTRSIFRMGLTVLALVLLFAGSFNLNRTSANEGEQIGFTCGDLGCGGGPILCAVIEFPDGTRITCYMADSRY